TSGPQARLSLDDQGSRDAGTAAPDGMALTGLSEVAELAEALAGSRERHQETMLLGEALLAAARAWPDGVFERLPDKVAY
ncbi:urease accessory UreF family protein, partial [Rhizobium ruizarguesonis]